MKNTLDKTVKSIIFFCSDPDFLDNHTKKEIEKKIKELISEKYMEKKKHHNQFVTSVKQLKKLCNQEHNDFVIILGGGAAYSRKDIFWLEEEKKFEVFNYIDDSRQYLSEEEIIDDKYTNIGKAMKLNSFIADIP